MCAVTSADGGSMTSPKSQNGSLVTSRLTLSASNAPQPPSLDCIPVSQVTPRCTAAADRGVAAVATRRSASSTSAVSSTSG